MWGVRDHQRDASCSCLGLQPCGLALTGGVGQVRDLPRDLRESEPLCKYLLNMSVPCSGKQQLVVVLGGESMVHAAFPSSLCSYCLQDLGSSCTFGSDVHIYEMVSLAILCIKRN